MPPAPFGFVCGIFWFGVFMIGHIAIFHWRPDVKRSQVLSRGVAAALAAAMFTAMLAPGTGIAAVLLREAYAVTAVSCLFVLYVPFFYSIHTSLSIETLILLQTRGGRAPIGELEGKFASSRLFRARLQTMAESGFLIQKGDRYALTPRARRVARVFAAIKSLWHLGPGG